MLESRLPFSKPLEFLHKVKYGGAVGKKTVTACVTLLILGVAIIAMWGQVYPILVVVVLAFAVFYRFNESVDKTLKAHPDLALMDGTEIVRIREMELGAKGMPPSPNEQIPGPKPVVEIIATATALEEGSQK